MLPLEVIPWESNPLGIKSHGNQIPWESNIFIPLGIKSHGNQIPWELPQDLTDYVLPNHLVLE